MEVQMGPRGTHLVTSHATPHHATTHLQQPVPSSSSHTDTHTHTHTDTHTHTHTHTHSYQNPPAGCGTDSTGRPRPLSPLSAMFPAFSSSSLLCKIQLALPSPTQQPLHP